MHNNIKLSLLALFLLFAFQTTSYADTFRWTGLFGVEWNNAANWSVIRGGFPAIGVPGANDDVIVPVTSLGRYPIIGNGSAESIAIRSLVIKDGVTLPVSNQSSLTVSGASADGIVIEAGGNLEIRLNCMVLVANTGEDGLDNSGIVNNVGTITIEGTTNNGLVNTAGGLFINSSNGSIDIGQSDETIGSNGIFNLGSSTEFTNRGNITIDNTGSNGIANTTMFTNRDRGSIRIGSEANISLNGITNAGTLKNMGSQSNIEISNTDGDGIGNSGTMSNTGTITIENTGDTGILNNLGGAITNDGTLNIGTNSQPTEGNGIRNTGSDSDVQNNGIINIERANDSAIRNESNTSFTNTDGATIHIGQNNGNISRQNGDTNGTGVRLVGSTFTNSGTIKIDNVEGSGIVNQSGGTFNNMENAIIDIGQNTGNIGFNGISSITSSTTFTNNGIISIDNTGADGIDNQNDFNNTQNADINIGQNGGNIGGRGIIQALTSTFTNDGTIKINIDNTANIGVQLNGGLFTGNENSAILNCVGDFIINSNGSVNITGVLELEGDWVNRGTFTAGTSSVVIEGISQSEIGGSSSTTFHDLEINNPGNVALGSIITINNELTLTKGKVNLDDFDCTLSGSLVLSNTPNESFLITNGTGKLIRSVTTGNGQLFPVGNTNYTPITIQNNSSTDDFLVQCLTGVPENGISGDDFTSDVVNTTWLIEKATAGSTNINLTANWTADDELGFDRSNCFISNFNGDWDEIATSAATGSDPYLVTRAGITSLSPFAIMNPRALDVKVSPKIFLQGSYDAANNIMTTSLNDNNLIPTTEPYTALGYSFVGNGGGETIANSVLNATGNDAIVDWVVIELRQEDDDNNPTEIVASRAALLQADGDVVDLDGNSSVAFDGVAEDDYYVAIYHRNHLAVLSDEDFTLTRN